MAKTAQEQLAELTKEQRDIVAEMLLNSWAVGSIDLDEWGFVDEYARDQFKAIEGNFSHAIECAASDGDLAKAIANNLEAIF